MSSSNCSYFRYDNVSAPNVEQQVTALGPVYYGVGITGTITTIILVVLFVINVIRHIKKSPARWRRLLAWITSTPMVVSFLSLLIFLVPRAGDTCDTVKQVYLPFVLMHFVDLALMIQGGEQGVIRDLVGTDTPLSLCAPPCCCFGICFRRLTFTKIKLRVIRGMIYQAPVFQLVLIMAMSVLDHADIISRNKTDAVYMVLSVLNILAFMFGIWGFNIANKAMQDNLAPKWERYILKSKVLSGFIVLLKMQNFVLVIVGFSKAIPCIEPTISAEIMRRNIDAGMTMLESFIFGVLFYVVYRAEEAATTSKRIRVSSKTGSVHIRKPTSTSSDAAGNDLEKAITSEPLLMPPQQHHQQSRPLPPPPFSPPANVGVLTRQPSAYPYPAKRTVFPQFSSTAC